MIKTISMISYLSMIGDSQSTRTLLARLCSAKSRCLKPQVEHYAAMKSGHKWAFIQLDL